MIPFKHPSTFLISGATQSGKTRFILRMLDSVRDGLFFDSSIARVWYCYGEYQPIFEKYKSFVHFHKGLPGPSASIFDGKRPSLLILDDLNAFVANIFTKISHHRDLSVVYVCQNLFDKSKYHRTISLNSHYIVLLRNPRDTQPVANLARQVFATDWHVAIEAYREATKEAYNYLLFDLHPSTEDRLRLRTNIFPGEQSYSYIKRQRNSGDHLTTERRWACTSYRTVLRLMVNSHN